MNATGITRNDLGIYSDSPFLDKVQKSLTRFLKILLSPAAIYTRDIIFALVIAYAFTYQLRSHSRSIIIDILFIGIIFILVFAVVFILQKLIFARIVLFVMGQPVFGKIGGSGRKFFFSALKCANAIKFEFKPEDMNRVKEFGKIDQIITEEILKRNYQNIVSAGSGQLPPGFEEDWAAIWNDQILKIQTYDESGNVLTFSSMMEEDNLSLRVEITKLNTVSLLVSPIMVLFEIVMIFFTWLLVNQQISLITILQISLILSLLVSSILFGYHSHQNAELPIVHIDAIPKSIIDPLSERLAQLGDEPFRPSKVIIKKSYLAVIRNYFASYLFWIGVINTITALAMLAIAFIIELVRQPGNIASSLPWYKYFSVYLLLTPIVFFAGFYLMFLALQHFRMLAAAVLIGILSITLPFIFNYFISGKIDVPQFQAALIAGGTGIITALVTAVTTKIKKNIEGTG